MFGKKNQAQYNAVDDRRQITNDFQLASTVFGYEGHRTVPYRMYDKLEDDVMHAVLDEHLKKLFAGNVDAGNFDMLHTLIFDAAKEGAVDLEMQRVSHEDTNDRLITRFIADRSRIWGMREARRAECEQLREDYEEACLALKKYEEANK